MKNYIISWIILFVCSLFASLIPVHAAEPDNTAEEADVILLNNETPMRYSFEYSQDEDWVKFYGLAGQTYEIEVTNVGANCDVGILLYDTDGIKPLDKADDYSDGKNETLEKWICPQNGIYYVRFYNNNLNGGERTGYEVRIFNPYAASVSGIISGTVKNFWGHPIEDAVIFTINPKNNKEVTSALSGSDGTYVILHIDGTWEISAGAEGYGWVLPIVFTVELPYPDNTINFTLHPLGDIDGKGATDLKDAILALQVMAGLYPGNVRLTGDVNNDGKIGAEEAVYILQIVSNLRIP